MKALTIVLSLLALLNTSIACIGHAIIEPAFVDGLGAASGTTIQKDIDVTPGLGPAYFFEKPQNDSEVFVNQGFAALNVFHYLDAYRSFRMAHIEDSGSVYPLVGLVISIFENEKRPSANALQLAKEYLLGIDMIKMARDLNAKETAWHEIAKAQFKDMGGDFKDFVFPQYKSSKKAYNELLKVDKDNTEVQTYMVWSYMGKVGTSPQKAAQSFVKVLASRPEHPGANHYLVHLFEGQNDISVAQNYAKELIKNTTASAHAQHMYGHTLPQDGKWQQALDMFLIADKIHKDWSQKYSIPLHEDWHYAHNLDLMAAAYLGLGDSAKAIDTWKMSMQYDNRATLKTLGLAIVTEDVALATSIIQQIAPSNKDMAQAYEQELKLALSTSTTELVTFVPSVFADQLSEYVIQIYTQKRNQAQAVGPLTDYFSKQLNEGGFDGWSHAFVDLLRLKKISEKLELNQISTALDNIITKAQDGTL